MSTGSPKLARRQGAIEATRRRLRRVEIEQHRIKAELARLEADYEDDFADWLSRKLRRKAAAAPDVTALDVLDRAAGDGHGQHSAASFALNLCPHNGAAETPCSDVVLVARSNRQPRSSRRVESPPAPDEHSQRLPAFRLEATDNGSLGDRKARRDAASYRKAASPLLCSFALHAIAFSLCLTFTIATIARQEIPLLSTPADLDESFVEEFSNVEIPTSKFQDTEVQNVVYETPEFNLSDRPNDVTPAEFGVGTRSSGDIGQLDALPSDLGTLMAGAGSPDSGTPGGAPGEAIFFGARSKGDRFVFVVDNSSSMKGGRLEASTAELLNATNALTPRQSFYVIFVSDQTYPMYYPQQEPDLVPATPVNKQRLAAWLPKAILASGNNRKLIDAMDMAAALRPHAVFLLWDGDMKYSDKVRLEVMTHLTRPNQWNFTVHTIGMGVTSLDAEQNLTTISHAHGGTFRKVEVPAGRGR